MSIVSLLPIILIGGMLFLMMRSSKNKQQQAQQMRNQMEPGVGVRTIGGMYALVKEVRDDAVELEVAPGVHAIYAKNAIAQVMDGVEYNRIVHGDDDEDVEEFEDEAVVAGADPIDAESPVLLDKADKADAPATESDASVDVESDAGDKAASSK